MIRAQGGDPDAALPGRRRPTRGARAGRRLPAPARRPGRGRRGVAAGRRPVPQGGPGVAHGRAQYACASRATRCEAGEPVLELHADDPARLAGALAALEGAIEIGPEPPEPRPLVVERIA